MLIGLIVVLGVGLVFAARSSRPALVEPLLTDHWHSAYEVYDCGTVLPAIQDQTDPDGIHTHGDGLIHIHPFNSSATGTDARLGVFFDASGLAVNEERIATPEYAEINTTSGCGDEDAEIKIARWNVDGPDGLELETVYTTDFGNIRYLHEREAFTIAKVAVGEDPPEPSATVLAQLDASTGTTNLSSDPALDLDDLNLDELDPEEPVPDTVP